MWNRINIARSGKKESESLSDWQQQLNCTEVNKWSAKPKEMQMTGEMSAHWEQLVFLWPTMWSDTPYCARLGHGNRPVWNVKIQNREADHVWPRSILSLYSQKCIPKLLFEINIYCKSGHRGNTLDVLNIVEFSLGLVTLIAVFAEEEGDVATTRKLPFHLSKQTNDTHGLLGYSNPTAMWSMPCLIPSRGYIANLQCERAFCYM